MSTCKYGINIMKWVERHIYIFILKPVSNNYRLPKTQLNMKNAILFLVILICLTFPYRCNLLTSIRENRMSS